MTSAPARASSRAFSSTEATLIFEASTISAKNPHVVARQVRRGAASAKIGGEVGDLLWAALEGRAKFFCERIEIGAATAGQDHAIGFQRARQAAQNDLLCHQRRDFHADVVNAPAMRRLAKSRDHSLEARQGEMAGEKEQALAHVFNFLDRRSAAGRLRSK
jgi:hypothetical protein